MLASFVDLWNYRELLRRLVIRNLHVRYQRSALGFLWALLNPLLTIVLLVGVFGLIIRIAVPSYWAFLLSGYFAWVFILHTLATSIGILPEHASMVKGVAFPTEILIYSQTLSRLIEFIAELVLVVVVLTVFHHHFIPASLIVLPAILVVHVLMVVGFALPAASLAVYFRDFQHAVPVGLALLGYVSPVYYPVSMVPQGLQALYHLNPMAGLLSLYHVTLFEGRFPLLGDFLATAAVAVTIFILGVAFFRRQRAFFAELI